jgi:sugar lactone lactonase YvrE
MYPTLIRKTESKPIRLFLQDGALDTWNPLFDNWYTQNRSMEESLSFAGYDVNHSWGLLGHEGSHANSIFPDVMRWLWRDYPKPIEAGVSGNSMQQAVLAKGETWNQVGGCPSAGALAAAPNGDIYYANKTTGDIFKIGDSGLSTLFVHTNAPIAAEAFGKDGTLYVAQPSAGKLLSVSTSGQIATVATDIHIAGLFISSDGSIYASQPGAHDDDPSQILRITPSGEKTVLDTGLIHSTGVVLTPDHNLLFAAEGHTHWIYSYVLGSDGTLQDKQRFYWLHVAESATDAGDWADSTDLAEDLNGFLYVATRMGVQVCDRNGRVEAILTLPDGQVSSLCFGSNKFDTLYLVCADKIYKRKMQSTGAPGFLNPIKLPGFGAG